jgi:hypothetical protein
LLLAAGEFCEPDGFMAEYSPNTVQELFALLHGDSVGTELIPKFLFRGQSSKEWLLTPSFSRIARGKKLDRNQALGLEHLLIQKFHPSAANLLPIQQTIRILPTSEGIPFLDWWVIMQHYGAPTRLLDWSASPWVALYFACSGEGQQDAKLWFFDTNKLIDAAEKTHNKAKDRAKGLTDPATAAYVDLASPGTVDERIDAQHSYFTFHSNPTESHEGFLERANALSSVVVKQEWKRVILRELTRMNITAKTLFPGLDGLAKYVAEIAQQ